MESNNPKKPEYFKKYGLKVLAIIALLGALQVIIFGEVGAVSTNSAYKFEGFERLFAIVFLFWAYVFWKISDFVPKNPEDIKQN